MKTTKRTEITTKKLAIVYQAGIANLFEVTDYAPTLETRNARRLYQGDFRGAELIAVGAALMGCTVRSFGCNKAGDVAHQSWTTDLESLPFSENFRPIHEN